MAGMEQEDGVYGDQLSRIKGTAGAKVGYHKTAWWLCVMDESYVIRRASWGRAQFVKVDQSG
jgi:hypothetical protein